MAVDASAEGLSVTQKWTYDWRDVILYNLSVGADSNVNPDELCFTWEKQLKAVPAFSSMTMGATFGAEPNVGGLFNMSRTLSRAIMVQAENSFPAWTFYL